MKAKIKATGEIVHVGDYNTISHDPMYKNERTGPWRLEELDFAIDPDYWTRLEHQYAGMAMQGILAHEGAGTEFRNYILQEAMGIREHKGILTDKDFSDIASITNKVIDLESEVDEYLKKMEEER